MSVVTDLAEAAVHAAAKPFHTYLELRPRGIEVQCGYRTETGELLTKTAIVEWSQIDANPGCVLRTVDVVHAMMEHATQSKGPKT